MTVTLMLLEHNDLKNEQVIETDLVSLEPFTFAEISSNAIPNKNASAKLQGTPQGHKVLILVDNGTTHNFISEQLVKTLKLLARRQFHF